MTHTVDYLGTFGNQKLEATMLQSGQSIHFKVFWGGILVDDCSATADCWKWANLSGAALAASEQKQLKEYAECQCFEAFKLAIEELRG